MLRKLVGLFWNIRLIHLPADTPNHTSIIIFYRGESYAGIYVPTLVDTIHNMNQHSTDTINLKGFMVCTIQ